MMAVGTSCSLVQMTPTAAGVRSSSDANQAMGACGVKSMREQIALSSSENLASYVSAIPVRVVVGTGSAKKNTTLFSLIPGTEHLTYG